MKKNIFDLIISSLSLFENPIYNYMIMAIIGFIAYKVAYYMVGELGFRGEIGSIAHWTIRIFIFVFIWALCCVMIHVINFVINNWIRISVCIILLLIICLLKLYSKEHPNSILNKKII